LPKPHHDLQTPYWLALETGDPGRARWKLLPTAEQAIDSASTWIRQRALALFPPGTNSNGPAASTQKNDIPKDIMKTIVGIDGRVTGALAAVYPDETWQVTPAHIIDCGRDKLLDVQGNLQFLNAVAERAGGMGQMVVACEMQKKNPIFGAKGEFWRVLLSLGGFSFCLVNPQTWQRDVLKGIPGTDAKRMARICVERRFPGIDLGAYNRSQREGIRDAICIAAWARSNSR